MRTPAPLWILLGSIVWFLGMSAPAWAQHGFVPPEDRPLHERLAEARVVAMASVARVDVSRIALRDAVAVRGAIEPEFELKRAPSRPPPWVEGDRVIVLLSGARSPYRWIEKPVETIAIEGAGAEARWAEALRDLDAVKGQPRPRRDLYARWCDQGTDDLRAAGLRGLLDVPGMIASMDAAFSLERAQVAADVERAVTVRRAAVRVATRYPDGITAMLVHLRDTDEGLDPEVAEVALQAGLRTHDEQAEPALLALLAHESPVVREVAMRHSVFARGADVERKLSEIAVGHSEAALREQATAALKKLRRNRSR